MSGFPGQDTDGISAIAETDPIDDLQSIGAIIIDAGVCARFLTTLEEPARSEAERVIQTARRLSNLTGLGPEMLLKRLGCDMRTLGHVREAAEQRLRRCDRFLSVVCQAVGQVPRDPDRREAVAMLAAVVKQNGQDAEGLERALKADGFAANHYLALAEIRRAEEAICREFGAGSPTANPYDGAPTVHVSLTRIDAFLRDDRRALGDVLAGRIAEHIEGCDACASAAEYRRGRLHEPASGG